MIKVPSRISQMIGRLEAGETLSREDLRRYSQLQALDIAKLGEDYVQQCVEREEQATQQLKDAMEA